MAKSAEDKRSIPVFRAFFNLDAGSEWADSAFNNGGLNRRIDVNRVFVDMDGVLVDFEGYMKTQGLTGEEVKRKPGAYLDMQPIPGAKEAVRSLIGMGFEVWIATKPPTGIPYAYSDKAEWVLSHLPELKRRIILTHDKGLLGGPGDYLCDDRPHKANCEKFEGEVLRFIKGYHWPQALAYLRTKSPNLNPSDVIPHKADTAQPQATRSSFPFSS